MVDKEEKKLEKEVSEERIDKKLEEIIETEGIFDNPSHIIKLLAKLIFNLRFDLNELKIELIKILKEDDEVTSYGELGVCNNDFYS